MEIIAVFPKYKVSEKVYLFGQQENVIYHSKKEFVKVGIEFMDISINAYPFYGFFVERKIGIIKMRVIEKRKGL